MISLMGFVKFDASKTNGEVLELVVKDLDKKQATENKPTISSMLNNYGISKQGNNLRYFLVINSNNRDDLARPVQELTRKPRLNFDFI